MENQVLRTRVCQAKIMRRAVSTILCQFCHTREETIQHLLAGCEALAPTKYLYQHNMFAKVVHWHLCKTFHVQLNVTSWHDHQPLSVVKNNEIKLLRGFGMVTYVSYD